MRLEGGDRHQEGDPEKAAPGKAEDCAQKPVEEAEKRVSDLSLENDHCNAPSSQV